MSQINGVVIGLVTKVDDPNKQGRVKVHFPWLADNHESDWIRVATMMGGNGRGSFFMPEVKDEVLIAFDHGDARFPYVVGFMWNGKDKPPNDDINTSVRRLQTVSGHLLEFDDNKDSQHIRIKTKGGHRLVLDDKSGSAKIELFDQQGQNTLLIDTAKNAIEITSQQGSITLKAPAGTIKLDALNLELAAQAKATMNAKASLELSGTASAKIESSGVLTASGSIIKLN